MIQAAQALLSSLEADSAVFTLLAELTRQPYAAKAWKNPVAEWFSDNRFFNGPPSLSQQWKPTIQALMASDKERFPELISMCCGWSWLHY